MASPQAACHRWLTTLGGGKAPSGEIAANVERVIGALEKYGAENLPAAAELLEKAAETADHAAALAAAKVEVDKRPKAVKAERAQD